jgi:hypothetical protein
MRVLSKLGVGAVVALVAVGAVAGAGAATAASGTGGDDPWGRELNAACTRVAARIDRVEKVQQRFHADANTKGSIAYLQARIDTATADGNAELVRLLTDRMAVRKDIDAMLPDVLTHLKDAQAVCQAHPAASGSASS